MFRNTYQAGFLSILYSIGSKPLQIWDKKGVHFARASTDPFSKGNDSYALCPPSLWAAAAFIKALQRSQNFVQSEMVTSSDSPTRTSKALCWK